MSLGKFYLCMGKVLCFSLRCLVIDILPMVPVMYMAKGLSARGEFPKPMNQDLEVLSCICGL